MDNYIRARVRERLAALGLSPFEAARRAGAERTFLNDLLIGRKETIRPAAIPRLAEVLECDPDYLIGAQAVPRKPDGLLPGTLPLAGICEAGVWRATGSEPARLALPITPDPRFPIERQAAYLIRGAHASGLGLVDGDVVVAVEDGVMRDGDVVISRRRRAVGEHELTVRVIEAGEVRARAGVSLTPRVPLSEVDTLGRVIVSHRIFM